MKQKNKENVENQIITLMTVLSTPRGKRNFTSPAELGFSKSIVENIKHLVRLEIEEYEITKKEEMKEKNGVIVSIDEKHDDTNYLLLFLYYLLLGSMIFILLVLIYINIQVNWFE